MSKAQGKFDFSVHHSFKLDLAGDSEHIYYVNHHDGPVVVQRGLPVGSNFSETPEMNSE